MAAPDINLSAGQILLTQSSSALGVIPVNNSIKLGTVSKINDLCDSVAVNDSVMYDSSKGKDLFYGSTIYVLINEEHISGVEVTPP